jgi:predicted DNA-binding antitoxin AbrB/MazE fold protein
LKRTIILQTVRAIYENGVFNPILNGETINLPEQTEVEITFETVETERQNQQNLAEELRDIAESMKANSFTGNPPPLIRDDLNLR